MLKRTTPLAPWRWQQSWRFSYQDNFGKLSAAIIASIAVLPIAGALILVGCVGSVFTPSFSSAQSLSQLVGGTGWWILGNISVIFAIIIGAAWSRSALAGGATSLFIFILVNYFTGLIFGITKEMLSVSSIFIMSMPHTIQTPLHFISVFGFPALDMGILVGIVSGGLGAFVYSRAVLFTSVSSPSPFILSRFVLVVFVAIIVSILTSALFSTVLPFVQYFVYATNDTVLHHLSTFPHLSLFVYGSLTHALSSAGLYPISSIEISYGYLNGMYTVGVAGGGVSDTVPLVQSGIAPNMLSDFALASAILAIYHSIHRSVRSSYRIIFLGGFFTILLTGYTSTIGFLLIFLSPILYVVHILFSGLGSVVSDLAHIHIHSDSLLLMFSAIPSIVDGGFGGSLFRLVFVGILYSIFVYTTFRVLIAKLRISAPGKGFNVILSTLNPKVPTTCSLGEDSGRFFDIKTGKINGVHTASWAYGSRSKGLEDAITKDAITKDASTEDASTEDASTEDASTKDAVLSYADISHALGGRENIVSLSTFHNTIVAAVVNSSLVAASSLWKLNLGATGIIVRGNTVQILYTGKCATALSSLVRESSSGHHDHVTTPMFP